ncbi:MAG: FHA domain-containing protein, partial [Deltaproteobacteria bacterium]|nr:FHA domain-containing protein [Deltaproteobacteria bacterium]
MLQLVLTRNGRPILKKPFEQEKIIIGRGHECEIQLFEPEISRQHCTLTKENGHFVLQDSSRNGTRVNGKKIGQTILHSKDQFEIGPWVIQIAKEEAKSDETVANKRVDARDQLGNMLGGSQAMQAVFEKIRKAAGANVPVAIQGESGTGKELAASLIHQLSARRDKPFVPINCGAIPSNLIESLLFGHEKG